MGRTKKKATADDYFKTATEKGCALTRTEWSAEVERLEPHECAFPTGLPLSRQRKKPCRGKACPNGRCNWHGGRSPSGPDHGRYVTGKYSKHMPTALAKKYREAEGDPELLSLRADVAVFQAMLSERLENMESGGGTGEAWIEANRLFARVGKAITSGDAQQLDESLRALQEILEDGASQHEQRKEIAKLIDNKGKTTDRENRRLKDLQQYMTMQQAMALMGFLAESIANRVTDDNLKQTSARGLRQQIHQDFARVLEGRKGLGLSLEGTVQNREVMDERESDI